MCTVPAKHDVPERRHQLPAWPGCSSLQPLPLQPPWAADALSVLELSVLFTLYPVHHELRALAAWHHSLASNDTAFAT